MRTNRLLGRGCDNDPKSGRIVPEVETRAKASCPLCARLSRRLESEERSKEKMEIRRIQGTWARRGAMFHYTPILRKTSFSSLCSCPLARCLSCTHFIPPSMSVASCLPHCAKNRRLSLGGPPGCHSPARLLPWERPTFARTRPRRIESCTAVTIEMISCYNDTPRTPERLLSRCFCDRMIAWALLDRASQTRFGG